MYEEYTHQALPPKKYRELLGTAICVFNSNNSFIIENILREDKNKKYSWHDLIDMTSGKLLKPVEDTITREAGNEISKLFKELIAERNRIIHSFQITNDKGEQALCTKYKDGKQKEITEEHIKTFIRKNDSLSSMLHDFRGY
ncbi:MAG: selenium binding protein [Bacteroides sp.]|nr:selenium binding protein [Bacteroides sp.]